MNPSLILPFIFTVYVTTNNGMSAGLITPTVQSSCGSWIPYTEAKCLRIADTATFQTKQEAEAVCPTFAETDDIPRLVTVESEAEQQALKQFLFEEVGILDHVWLGVERGNDGVLRWKNELELHFNNLADQNITSSDRQCVQMESGQGIYPMGQWVRVNCRKRNLVVCEKTHVWTTAKLQNSFLNFKSKMERQLENIRLKPRYGIDVQAKTANLGKVPEKTLSVTQASSRCSDWTPYKDIKCLKVAMNAGHQTKEEAERVCQSFSEGRFEASPRLLTVKTKEDQEFIQHFLFRENHIVDNVWLGLQRVEQSEEFVWSDGTSVVYNNWVGQNITDERNQCVQMASGEEHVAAGLWFKLTCKKANVVVCERTQTWSLETLQDMLLNYKLIQDQRHEASDKEIASLKRKTEMSEKEITSLKQKNVVADREIASLKQRNEASDKGIASLKQKDEELDKEILSLKQRNEASEKEIVSGSRRNEASEKQIASLKQRNDALEKETDNLKRNPVPLGFIYVQLSGQQPPSSLWTQTTWTDVSSSYSGLFFRVVGGNSTAFGTVQEGNSPKLAEVQYNPHSGDYLESIPIPPDGSWSKYFWTGGNKGRWHYQRLRYSKDEVRPRNQAMKVWKRT